MAKGTKIKVALSLTMIFVDFVGFEGEGCWRPRGVRGLIWPAPKIKIERTKKRSYLHQRGMRHFLFIWFEAMNLQSYR